MSELVHHERLSPNYDERHAPVSMVVIHYTEMENATAAIDRLTDWRGESDVNGISVGIELDHPGHALGYREFSEAQIGALLPLLHSIVKRHDVPRANVVGHSDVAPHRKIDPGELFPWAKLAEHGLCLPRPTKLELGDPFDNDGAFYLAMERFGYDISDGEIRAILFQLLLDRDRGLAR